MLNEIPHESSQLNEMRNDCAIPCPKLYACMCVLLLLTVLFFGMPEKFKSYTTYNEQYGRKSDRNCRPNRREWDNRN